MDRLTHRYADLIEEIQEVFEEPERSALIIHALEGCLQAGWHRALDAVLKEAPELAPIIEEIRLTASLS